MEASQSRHRDTTEAFQAFKISLDVFNFQTFFSATAAKPCVFSFLANELGSVKWASIMGYGVIKTKLNCQPNHIQSACIAFDFTQINSCPYLT